MHKTRISGMSNVPCIIFCFTGKYWCWNSICPCPKAPQFIICHQGVIYKLCDSKQLSRVALFMMLGSIKVHTSNVSPKIGFCNWTNKLYCEPLKSKSPTSFWISGSLYFSQFKSASILKSHTSKLRETSKTMSYCRMQYTEVTFDKTKLWFGSNCKVRI